MKNGYELYKRIGEQNTYAHQYNRLPDNVRNKISFDSFKQIKNLKQEDIDIIKK